MCALQAYYKPGTIEAGCDEAGRGCLAGPVVAAAVILPQGYDNPLLNDSKKMSAVKRTEVRRMLEEDGVDWATGIVSPGEIDTINILQASLEAMHRALKALKQQPGFILVDGNRFRAYHNIPYQCIVKGDGLFQSIAAASVFAKTTRDEIMTALHESFPVYGWNVNKGYPTAAHIEAINQHGSSIHHRKSFSVKNQLKLF